MTTTSAVLFPIPTSHILYGFTTCPTLSLPHVSHVALSDKALGVHKVSSRFTHNVVVPPHADADHSSAWEALFAAGSIAPGNKDLPPGGFGLYMRGPSAFKDELAKAGDDAQEVLMSYEVLFEDGFEWQKGGKLPGLYGGVGEFSYGCTGGRNTDRCKCFNLRLMWREGGLGELYAYVPQNDANTVALKAVPRSHQNPDYGFSVGRGLWTFEAGEWFAVAERVKMNDVGQANGEIEIYINGASVIFAKGLVLRDPEAPGSSVQGLHVQTFFGGHTAEWASPKEQKAWFTNISGAVLSTTFPAHDEL